MGAALAAGRSVLMGEPPAAQKTQGKKMPALRLAKEGFVETDGGMMPQIGGRLRA